jgi:hypothetical protein
MGRRRLPAELLRSPFTVKDARRAGLKRWHLESSAWQRVGYGSYAWAGLDLSPLHHIQAAKPRLPDGAVFGGLTAAWLHGLDVSPCDPIEVIIPPEARVSSRAGMAVRRSTLPREDVATIRGFPVTSVPRTLADSCSRVGLIEGVVMLDAALHVRKVKVRELDRWAENNGHRHGIRLLRRALDLAEPLAESPMETRLRLILVLAGLPRPKAQVSIYDRWGRCIGRPDLYYESHRLGIEYDGGVHRDRLTADNRRQNALLKAGVRLLRFSGADVLGDPALIVGHVRAMLAERVSAA